MKKLLILLATILAVSTTAFAGFDDNKAGASVSETQQTVQNSYPKPKPMPRLLK